jgi:hypothetical protein
MALAAGGVRAGGLALVQPPMESRKGAGGAEQIFSEPFFNLAVAHDVISAKYRGKS